MKNLPSIHSMEKYFAFIFLSFPQLLLAQTGDLGTKHGFRAGDELSREVVAFDGKCRKVWMDYGI